MTRWIPEDLKGVVTFFSEYDLWDFSNINYHTCNECEGDSYGLYQGTELRSLFPWLEILDEDTIAPNVHPNCTCTMHRVAGEDGYSTESRFVEQTDYRTYESNELEAIEDFGGYW